MRILRLEEEADYTEGVLEAKIIQLAGDTDVKPKTENISVAHRLGKPRERPERSPEKASNSETVSQKVK